MRFPSIPGLYANPFVTWTSLAWKTTEMMVNSGQVIGQRLAGMALAGPAPSLRDRREMALMGREKIEAGAESAYAMGWYLLTLNQQLAALAMKQMLSGTSAMMSVASSRTAAESLSRQTKLMGDAMTHTAATASHLSSSTARLAHRGLKPISTRARRNAKRLRKR
jgi:hypothetical protein